METNSIKPAADAADAAVFPGDDWFDPLEAAVRTRVRDVVLGFAGFRPDHHAQG